MASQRVRSVHNGGYVTSSSLDSEELYGWVGRSRSLISRQLVKKNFLQIASTPRLRVAASRRSDNCMNVASNSSGFDHLIRNSDRTCADWTEITNVRTKKRMADMEEDNSKKLDQWMRDSVAEIVSNIGKAPFLVHIYSEDEMKKSPSNTAIRLVIERAVAETWPVIRGRWDGGSPKPNGVILVEELKNKEDGPDEEKQNVAGINYQLPPATKIWGVLIQAKGLNCTACYILKTCRVQTFFGFCTHFCLFRVECFVENAEIQLKKLWLHG